MTSRLLLPILLSILCTHAQDIQEAPTEFPDEFSSENFPGQVITTTDREEIEKALNDVQNSADFLQTRTVAIGLSALDRKLVNPRFYLKDGMVFSSLPPEIGGDQTGLMLFTKTSIGVYGVWGVVTYDIEGTNVKMALMFNVPFNGLGYDNKYNFKVYDQHVPVDQKLVKQMYKYAGPWSPGGYEERWEYGVSIKGTMTDNSKAKIILWVNATMFDRSIGPSRNAECDWTVRAIGNRCWRECTPTSWCWTKTACSSKDDCHGNLPCRSHC